MSSSDASVTSDASAAPRPALSRERIARAALALIDRRGLDACTMRALGAELGVEAMSLYRHVPGKDGVRDAVVELMVADLQVDPQAGPEGWRALLDVRASGPCARPRAPERLPADRPPPARGVRGQRAAGGRRPGRAGRGGLLTGRGHRRPAERGALRDRLLPGRDRGRRRAAPRAGAAGAAPDAPPGDLFAFGLGLLLDGLEARLTRRA